MVSSFGEQGQDQMLTASEGDKRKWEKGIL